MDSLDTTTNLDNPRAVMGGNNPPSPMELLIDNLTLANVDLIARRDALIEAVGRVPEVIDNDDVAGKVADFIKQISVTAKAAEDSRVEATKPHLEAQRAVGGFFKKLTEPLDAAKARLNDRLTAHLRRKADAERARIAEEQRQAAIRAEEEAAKNQDAFGLPAVDEAPAPEPVARETKAADLSRTRGDYGSVTSLRETWEFEITDIKAIPLASLRPFLARDAIEKAIRGYVKAYQDGKPLKGVRVFKDAKAVTR